MKTAKALVMVAGMTMLAGAAMARPQVDPDDLLGAWDASIEGNDGDATVRVVFADNGTYLAVAIVAGGEDPVPFWETGEWKVRGSRLTFEALASSEEQTDDEKTTVLTIDDLTEDSLNVSSDSEPMWSTLDFHRPEVALVGLWTADTEEGPAVFAMCEGGGFAGSFGEAGGPQEVFWGSWSMDGDEVTFAETSEGWTADLDAEFTEHTASIEDMDEGTWSMMAEDLGEDPIEWEQAEVCPLIGEWAGEPDGDDVTLELNDDATFTVSMEGEDGEEFTGIWTIVGPGMVFFAVTGGDMPPVGMHFVMTSPTTIMFGKELDEMAEFERQ